MLTVSRRAVQVVMGASVLLIGACSNGVNDQVVGGSALLGEPQVGALSTTASYRTVIAKFKSDAVVCPEPPPDVAVAVTAALTASLSAESKSLDAEGTAALSRAVAESITPLLRRTSAVQFYRDARSYNCFAHMNGALTAEQYAAANTAVMLAAKELLHAEIAKGFDPIDPEALQNSIDEATKALKDMEKPQTEN
ncbi:MULTISPECIES: hypothetical protein [unclassified Thalassospira]|uniref:hypothetical protein n=1 Tax=unclassified Thalassospira TaxID=2648997 RepID=UPI000A4B5154|nr:MULTISPECIES: hypothetical protein [unclassified Thalassospira]